MSTQNLETLIPLLERFVIATETIAAEMGSKPRQTSKKEEMERRIAHMLAWVDQTVETSQKKVAEEFALSPSALSHPRYEPVKRALSMNKVARRRVLMQAGTTSDDFTDEVLNE